MDNQKLIETYKNITQTLGGFPVRNLKPMILVHTQMIMGEILFPGDTEWSRGQWFKSGTWSVWGTRYDKTEFDNLYNLNFV